MTQNSVKITWAGFFVNLFLGGLKFIAGFIFNSAALIADALHSISDTVTDLIALFGLAVGNRPVDKNHPYGHGRIETFFALLIAFILVIAAVFMGYETFQRFHEKPDSLPSWPAVVVAGISILVKEILYRMTMREAKRTRSRLLEANAWHHRSDALSSAAAFLGIGITVINHSLWYFDLIASGLVVLMIMHSALKIAYDAAHDLIDTAQDEELTEESCKIAQKNESVKLVHKIRSRRYGSLVFIDLHIQVDKDMSIYNAHIVSHAVSDAIKENLKQVEDVLIHIEPYNAKTV